MECVCACGSSRQGESQLGVGDTRIREVLHLNTDYASYAAYVCVHQLLQLLRRQALVVDIPALLLALRLDDRFIVKVGVVRTLRQRSTQWSVLKQGVPYVYE